MKALIEQLKAARAVSTPLIMITSPDQPGIAQEITEKLNGDTPVVSWDRAAGLAPRNKQGIQALKALIENAKTAGVIDSEFSLKDLAPASTGAASAMRFAKYLPKHSVLIAFSLDRFLKSEEEGSTVQAILNLRDLFKSDNRTLIGLSPSFVFPSEIQHDVILLDDPLPTNEGYTRVVNELYDAAGLKAPKKEDTEKITRAVRGLSAFESEQVLSMSLALNQGKCIDLESAWDLKRAAVSKVAGLTMTLTGPSLDDLFGLDNVVKQLGRLFQGPNPPELVVRVDEIDKSMAGLGSRGGPGDNTGISQDLNQQFLVNMEDNGWDGAILVGIRGSGKTVLTQSIGAKFSVPTISMDTGAMKAAGGGIVGTSEHAFREAFRTFKSIGGSRVLVLATCNKLDVLPPELMRRFKLGIFYFDLPSKQERDSLWPVYLKKYGLDLKSERPNDEGWTGAEIRNCCELAFKMNVPVKEVGEESIVPVTQSDPQSVLDLRQMAHDRFKSASKPGRYLMPSETSGEGTTFAAPTVRKLNLGGQ